MGHLGSSYCHLLSFLSNFLYLRTLSYNLMFGNKLPPASVWHKSFTDITYERVRETHFSIMH
jgi:hypothetical protein